MQQPVREVARPQPALTPSAGHPSPPRCHPIIRRRPAVRVHRQVRCALPPEQSLPMNLRNLSFARLRSFRRPTIAGLRAPRAGRRPALYLGVAAAGALMVNVMTAGEPAAPADPAGMQSVSVAQQLGITADTSVATVDAVQPLQQMAASRSDRQADQVAAAQAQAAADQPPLRARVAAEAAAAAAAAPPSFHDYALSKLGGDGGQFSCLENLWGRESGWNPNAQNQSSTAYGIPQFLDSTWAGTGIGKTSDGYRQIDAGLIYIDGRYGSPCGAGSRSQASGWY